MTSSWPVENPSIFGRASGRGAGAADPRGRSGAAHDGGDGDERERERDDVGKEVGRASAN